VALAAAAGVVAALAVLLWDGFVALLAALAALVIAAAAAWVALSRGGVARLSAFVIAGLALAGGAAALVLLGALDDLIVFAAASVIFAVAARMALQHAARADVASTGRAAGLGGSSRVLLLNPKSGGGKVAQFDLVNAAKRRGIECVVLEPGDDLQALARDAARSAEVIGMAGGDGSQALVAQVAMERDVGFVCIPAGTRNHLALDLGLDHNDVVGALEAFSGEVERRVDLGFLGERVFVNNVSLGVYAEIVRSPAYREAKLATTQELLPELLGPRGKPFDLRFRGPDGNERTTAQLLLVSNNPYILDRLAGIGSRPRLDTGLLGIVAVEIPHAAAAAKLVSLHAVGQVRRFEGWRQWTAETFEVRSTRSMAAGVDGEALELDPPLRFRVVPGALRVHLPPAAPGLSPAALSPGITRSSVRALWDIATGQRSRSA
jgi:diacylglycerol kinase family enzyme